MIELGLMAGDPCAPDDWSHDQQTRAFGWWMARTHGAPSVTGIGAGDLVRIWTEIVQGFEGFRRFLVTWRPKR